MFFANVFVLASAGKSVFDYIDTFAKACPDVKPVLSVGMYGHLSNSFNKKEKLEFHSKNPGFPITLGKGKSVDDLKGFASSEEIAKAKKMELKEFRTSENLSWMVENELSNLWGKANCDSLRGIRSEFYAHLEEFLRMPTSPTKTMADTFTKKMNPFTSTDLYSIARAVKMMRTELKVSEMFKDVDNVVQFVEAIRYPDWTFGLVMKKAPGYGLTDVWAGEYERNDEKGKLVRDRIEGIKTEGQKLTIATRMLNGLANIHAKGVVHTDFSPTNVQVHLENDVVKSVRVIDFGESRLMTDKQELKKPVSTKFPYRPADWVDFHEITQAYDIWSAGMNLFVLFCGMDAHEKLTENVMSHLLNGSDDERKQFKKGWEGFLDVKLGECKLDPKIEDVKFLIKACLWIIPVQSKSTEGITRLETVSLSGHRQTNLPPSTPRGIKRSDTLSIGSQRRAADSVFDAIQGAYVRGTTKSTASHQNQLRRPTAIEAFNALQALGAKQP